MFFSQGFSRIAAKIPRNSLSSCRWFLSRRPDHHPTFIHSNEKEQLDPSSLVADEVSLIAKRLQSMVVTEIPKFASAAGYFFKVGVEGKSLCPTVLLLMPTALDVCKSDSPIDGIGETLMPDLRQRQQYVAEIAEMINVGSVIHNEVLDDADTRRGIASLSSVMSNKIAVLTGDLLISQALVALSLLKNAEVISLMSTALENLVTGETMQMTATSEQRCSMEYYMQKAYYKTASLSNGCKAVAYLADQKEEVATLAFEYGKNLGLAYQLVDDILGLIAAAPASPGKCSSTDIQHRIITTAPILFAMEEFPQLRAVVDSSFNNPAIANVDTVLEYLGKSNGIQRTIELAVKHTKLAALAIDSLPETNDMNARKARRALIHFTQKIITRNKIPRKSLIGCRWVVLNRPHTLLFSTSHSVGDSTQKVLGCREAYTWSLPASHGIRHQIHHQSSSLIEEELDPFSLVADELSLVANRLRSMVVAEVPKLASAAEYFFKMGVEGKRFRPTVLLLMASALNMRVPEPLSDGVADVLTAELRTRQQCIAEITEMIHIPDAVLVH